MEFSSRLRVRYLPVRKVLYVGNLAVPTRVTEISVHLKTGKWMINSQPSTVAEGSCEIILRISSIYPRASVDSVATLFLKQLDVAPPTPDSSSGFNIRYPYTCKSSRMCRYLSYFLSSTC